MHERPLRLLSLDGGGIRGFSELKILQVIMHRIQWDLNLDQPPLPCDYFDLIGGTSTGGIIAILLGRLRLSVEKCLEMYASLSKEVFGYERWGWGFVQDKFDHKILERVIQKELGDIESLVKIANGETTAEESEVTMPFRDPPIMTGGSDVNMFDEHSNICRAFVCATPGSEAQRNSPSLFRTYASRESNAVRDCKVWEAIRATSAAPTFFGPIHIDGSVYVDGGFGCNNPCEQVYEEALKIWPHREVGIIISLGTGMPRVLSLENPSYFDRLWPKPWIQTLERIATQCQAVHHQMYKKRELKGKYYRFNVEQGLQTVSLSEWTKLGEVGIHTEQYTRDADVTRKLDEAVEKILDVDRIVLSEDLSQPPSYAQAMNS
ncbi:hypothetical protein FRC17_001547 [Serendipita sp. 399]|nr:hypothetical protein FRC17_001547 [Serendipita sp. 399]